MKPIFETCQPRDEVLRGELKDEIFAARLKDVIDEKAEAVYQDPRVFFDSTYPTSGLKTLLKEALGRLTGRHGGGKPSGSGIGNFEYGWVSIGFCEEQIYRGFWGFEGCHRYVYRSFTV